MRQAGSATKRSIDSEDYQYLPQPVVAMAKEFSDGFTIKPHSHARAQLLYATRGVMRVSVSGQVWIVPPLRAVWIPARVEHTLQMIGATTMRTLYIEPDATPWLCADCRVIEVSNLLRALILSALELPLECESDSRAELVSKLILSELQSAVEVRIRIPMPQEPQLLKICQTILANPETKDTLERWAERMGISGRTLARRFMQETGMSFGKWRQQARLAQAVCRLAAGQSSMQIARDLGYQSGSAFTAMFRKTLGQAPQRYYKQGDNPVGLLPFANLA